MIEDALVFVIALPEVEPYFKTPLLVKPEFKVKLATFKYPWLLEVPSLKNTEFISIFPQLAFEKVAPLPT